MTGPLAIDFQTDPQSAGQILLNGFNGKIQAVDPDQARYSVAIATPLPQPQLQLQGQVITASEDRRGTVIVRHASLPLLALLKQLNMHSNNDMAEILAQLMGGASVVIQKATTAAGVPNPEVLLQNGSGLGQENRLSARSVTGLLLAIHQHLKPQNLSIADVFPISGRDQGTLKNRQMPTAAVVKTGTLWDVSALAGVLPTRQHGLVWFTIINRGPNHTEGFRQEQDRFLQTLSQAWGVPPSPEFSGSPPQQAHVLGDPARNQVIHP